MRLKKQVKASFITFAILVLMVAYGQKCWAGEDEQTPFRKGIYLGFTAGLGGNFVKNDTNTYYRASVAFNTGLSILDVKNVDWFGFYYSLQYKKFFLKNNDRFLTFDFGSIGMGFFWKIKNFILIIPGVSYNYSLRQDNRSFNGGVFGSIGYMFQLNKKIIMPVRIEFDCVLAGGIENLSLGILFGIYLKIDLLFLTK